MPALLTSGAASIAPLALSDYSADQEGGSIRHDILGRREPDITLRPVGMRNGDFTLDFPTEPAVAEARESLSAAAVWTLVHSERPSVNMRFIVRRLSRAVAADGRWSIRVSFEETEEL